MTKENFIKLQENRKTVIVKTLIYSLLAIVFVIVWFMLFSLILDTYFPNRVEEKIPFYIAFSMQLLAISPVLVFIGIGFKKVTHLSDYFATMRVRKPINYNLENLSLESIKSRTINKKYEEVQNFTYPSLIFSAYKKRHKITQNDIYILFFKYNSFNVNHLDTTKHDLEKRFLKDKHFTCFIFVISDETDIPTKDYLSYSVETVDSLINISLYEKNSNQFYFKHPFISGKNNGTAKISNYNPIYNLFIGQSFKSLPKRK